jgi:hypothetical protein
VNIFVRHAKKKVYFWVCFQSTGNEAHNANESRDEGLEFPTCHLFKDKVPVGQEIGRPGGDGKIRRVGTCS